MWCHNVYLCCMIVMFLPHGGAGVPCWVAEFQIGPVTCMFLLHCRTLLGSKLRCVLKWGIAECIRFPTGTLLPLHQKEEAKSSQKFCKLGKPPNKRRLSWNSTLSGGAFSWLLLWQHPARMSGGCYRAGLLPPVLSYEIHPQSNLQRLQSAKSKGSQLSQGYTLSSIPSKTAFLKLGLKKLKEQQVFPSPSPAHWLTSPVFLPMFLNPGETWRAEKTNAYFPHVPKPQALKPQRVLLSLILNALSFWPIWGQSSIYQWLF